jgi:hypothetical protein
VRRGVDLIFRKHFSVQRSIIIGNDRGATIVEAMVSLPTFLFVVCSGLELLRFAMIMLASQMAVIEGLRHVITGECGSASCSGALRANYAQTLIIQKAAGVGVQLTQDQVCIRPASVKACSPEIVESAGNAGDFLVAEVSVPFHLLIGMRLPLTIKASAIGRNEPFPE